MAGVRHRSVESSPGANQHANINVDLLATSIKNMIPTKLSFSPKSCIFKVPYILRRHNAEAYVPTAFSIGPWHRNKPHLKPAEEFKLKYLNDLLLKSTPSMLNELIRSILEVEEEARACYSGPVDVGTEEFVKLLVLDGCFIIELFRKHAGYGFQDDDYPIFKVSSMLQVLFHDLLLLENQIPWLVLERLFNMTKNESEIRPLSALALLFFYNIFSTKFLSLTAPFHEERHILDLLRRWLISSSEERVSVSFSSWQPIPSATNLTAAGIKFRKLKAESILDIKFRNGILEIPGLLLQETTEVFFRNLICYEQCCPGSTNIVTSYVIFLSNLICTVKDMNILVKNEIIENWMDPESAVRLLNKLYQDVYVEPYHYIDLCKNINYYCRRGWPRLRAIYLTEFTSPWAVASQVVAGIILILTFLQTIFTIISK